MWVHIWFYPGCIILALCRLENILNEFKLVYEILYMCVCVCVINMIFFLHCKYIFISYEVFIFISYIEYLFMNNLCAWKAHIEILLWFSVESSGLINRLIFICLGSLAYSLCTTCLASCWRGCFTFVDLLLGVIKIVSQQVALNTTASRKSRKKNHIWRRRLYY